MQTEAPPWELELAGHGEQVPEPAAPAKVLEVHWPQTVAEVWPRPVDAVPAGQRRQTDATVAAVVLP